MAKQAKSGKQFYFGWWVVIVGFIVMAFISGPAINLAGLLVKPLAEDFGVPRTVAAMAVTISSLAGMVMALFAGRILTRWSIRAVVATAAAGVAACYFVFSFAPSIYVILVGTALRGMFNILCTVVPLSALVNNWFGRRVRGRVWGIVMIGSGAGAMLFSPVVGMLLKNWGWRWAYGFFGMLALVCVPLILLTYVRAPANKGLAIFGDETSGAGAAPPADTRGISALNALRTPMFWMLILSVVLLVGGVQVWIVNSAAYLADLGFDVMWVSYATSGVSIGLTVGKLIIGAINDKFGTRAAAVYCALSLIVGYLLSLFVGGAPFLVVFMCFFVGGGLAMSTVMVPLITRDLMGNRDYVILAGYSQSALGFSFFASPILASLVYDLSGSYIPAWLIFCAASLLGIVATFIAYHLKPAAMKKYGF